MGILCSSELIAAGYSWTSGDYENPNGVTITGLPAVSAVGSTLGTFTNNGAITSFSNDGFDISGNVQKILNAGDINGYLYGIKNFSSSNISSIVNTGSISSTSGSSVAISNNGFISLINNSGTISGQNKGIGNTSGTITTIENSGVISATGSAIYIATGSAPGAVGAITNTGTLTGTTASINNVSGTLGTLNNLQGLGNGSGAVIYVGNLPTNYNIIVNSQAQFGQLSVSSVGSSLVTFGIYAGSVLTRGTYQSVLSGLTASNLNNVSGNYNGFTWSLYNSSGSIWNLIVTGASTADTQASLQNTATALKSTYALQNSVIANSLNYDCQVFDKNDVCVSAGGRNTNVQAGGVNNVSALLIAAYRAMPEVRIGAYLDQNLSVTSSSSPVTLGNGGPLFGVFGVWNQNPEGTETEVKVSASFGQKNTTTTRAIVGTSEAGVGSSSLNNSGVQAIAKYGFAVTKDAMVSPYIGLRYSQGNMGGYAEAVSGTVTTPLTYAALNTNATTFMLGVHGKYKVTPEAVVQASVGLESDTSLNNGSLTATGLTGLTAINFNPNPVKTRPVAMLGTYYDIEKAQRVALTGIYRQEPFQAIGSTTVLATYTVGF